jgi:hypothetical protein
MPLAQPTKKINNKSHFITEWLYQPAPKSLQKTNVLKSVNHFVPVTDSDIKHVKGKTTQIEWFFLFKVLITDLKHPLFFKNLNQSAL